MGEDQATSGDAVRLDLANACAWRGAHALRLTPKVFAVLQLLVEHAGRLVTKSALLDAVWPDTTVSEAALTVCIGALRRELGDDPRSPRFIETVSRRGYRFIGPVARPEASTPVVSPPRSVPGSSPPALVGRDAELARLHAGLGEVHQGARRVTFIAGELGVGKTTLVDAFLEQALLARRFWFARGQCIEHYGPGEAYLPVLDALGQLCREGGDASPRAYLARYAPAWLAHLPGLASEAELEPSERQVGDATRERMMRQLAEFLEILTTHIPLVLVLEDLHWSDYASLDLIAWLARRRQPAQLFLIGTYRPVDVMVREHPLRSVIQELTVHRLGETLSLERLTEPAVEQYVTARLGTRPLPAGLVRRLYQRTGGNPLFLTTVIDTWVRQGWPEQAHAQPTDIGTAVEDIPESLRQLILQQYDALDPDTQQVLDSASVTGHQFTAAAVAAGLEGAEDQTETSCDALVRRGQWLRGDTPERWADGTITSRYQFVHSMYQEVVYQRLSMRRRAQLHQRIGARAEAAYGQQASERAAELGIHFLNGQDAPRAVLYLRLAADNALRRWGYEEAIAQLSLALQVLPALPATPERAQEELRILTVLGPALIATQGHAAPEVERVYARARDLCGHIEDTQEIFPVLRGLSIVYLNRAELRTAHQLAERRLRLAEAHHDPAVLLGAHDSLGAVLYHRGEFALARKHLEEGVALYQGPRQPPHAVRDAATDHGVACLGHLAWVLWFIGHAEEALRRSGEAIALARALAHPFSLAQALYWAAQLHQLCRNAALAREHADAAMRVAIEQGFPQQQAQGLVLCGWTRADQGHREEGIQQMRDGIAAWEATGAKLLRPYYLCLLAEAHTTPSLASEGLRLVAEALTVVQSSGERNFEAELNRVHGELLLASPAADASSAELSFRRALALARKQQAKALEVRAAMSLGRLWQARGKRANAHRLLAEVYGRFSEGFDTADLTQAKATLTSWGAT